MNRDVPSIGGPIVTVDPDGPVPASALPSDAMVDLEGAFDHPAARDCRAGAAGPGAVPIAATAAALSCRARFVVTRVRVDPEYPVWGSAAITVSDDLRVRAEPGLTSVRYELLPTGTPVWVIYGPSVKADYEWFQVIVPGVDTGDGAPRVGWVAASDHGGERWLAKRTLDCPDQGSLDIADLMRLTSPDKADGALACFGSMTIRFEGTPGLLCGVEDRPGWEMTPNWLSANAVHKLTIRDGDAFVIAHPRPELGLPVDCGGVDAQRYTFDGHFDDDEASECVATRDNGTRPADFDLVPEYWCRTTLVIDAIEPTP